MDKVTIEKVNEVYVRVVADPDIKMEMSVYFTFEVPGAKFMPAVRNKIWDGKIRLLNPMTGLIYAGLIPNIAKFCRNRDYDIELASKDVWPLNKIDDNYGRTLAEEFDCRYETRDYQNAAVVYALRNNRGLLLSPTASGKSLIIYLLSRYHTEQDRRVLIVVPTTSLVHQMAKDFVDYNRDRPLDIHRITGGVEKNPEKYYTFTLENGNKYKYYGNEFINIINIGVSKKLAKDITKDDEIDDRWLSTQSSKQVL